MPGSVRPVSVTLVEIVEHERRFPAAVEAELSRRHERAMAAARGRILDLDDPGSRVLLAAAMDHGPDRPVPPAWDAVVSVAQLVRFPDLGAALVAIDRLLLPAGRLFVVEPVARPGTLRMFVDAPFAVARSVRGFHIGRDVPAVLRTTTLVADDIERFSMRTSLPALRHFVSIEARRPDATSHRPTDQETT